MTFTLRFTEEWPLFCLTKYISDAQQVWVVLTDLPQIEGKPDGLLRLCQEMRRLEHRLECEGIVGWLQAIRKGNTRMRRWTEMVGATLFAVTENHWHFQKPADWQHFPKTPREAVRQYRGLHHVGTA
jgi:hypothetical protein